MHLMFVKFSQTDGLQPDVLIMSRTADFRECIHESGVRVIA
jgi:hypothetical protein